MVRKDVVIPYDEKILERMQAQSEAEQLTPEQRALKAELLRALDQVDERLGLKARPSDKKAPDGPTIDPDKGILFLNGQPISLEANEHDVLKQLVASRAMTLKALRTASGCEHPDRVLRNLQTKHDGLEKHIKLPGRKGRGGYSTTIRLAD